MTDIDKHIREKAATLPAKPGVYMWLDKEGTILYAGKAKNLRARVQSYLSESGDGRHNDVQRELSGVFHAITGANGRFKTGQILDIRAEGIDVYNTMLRAMGATDRLGPADRELNPVEQILS